MAPSNAISWPSQCICSPSGVNVLDPIFASVVSLGCALIFAVAFCRTGLVVYVVDVGWWTSGAAVVCKRIRSHSCGCECEGRERLLGWKWSESNGSDELKLLVWAQHLLQAGTFLRLRSGPTKEHRQTDIVTTRSLGANDRTSLPDSRVKSVTCLSCANCDTFAFSSSPSPARQN